MEDVDKIHAIFRNEEIAELDENFDSYLVEFAYGSDPEDKLYKFECSSREFVYTTKSGICEIVELSSGFDEILELIEYFTFAEIVELNRRFPNTSMVVGLETIFKAGFKVSTLGTGKGIWYTDKLFDYKIVNVIPPEKPRKNTGMKFDDDKLLCMAMPAQEYKQILEVLTNGAKKYKIDNWKHVDDGRNRYMNGLERHFLDYKEALQTGNDELKFDNGEGGMGTHHLANLICNAIFLMYYDNNNID